MVPKAQHSIPIHFAPLCNHVAARTCSLADVVVLPFLLVAHRLHTLDFVGRGACHFAPLREDCSCIPLG